MRNSLKWAAAAASVLVLSLLSVQQTGAAWRDSVPISEDTFTAGRLDLNVGDESGVLPYDFKALAGPNMAVGETAHAPLKVFNSGNVDMKYTLTGVDQSEPSVKMNVSLVQVANEAACTANATGPKLFDGLMAPNVTGAEVRPVPVGGSEVLCVKVTMKPSPADLGTTATLKFRAEVNR